MKHYTRSMTWADTGLKWVPTSPNIPTVAAAFGYAMTGLGTQLGTFRHGIGTPYPFRFLTHPNIHPEQLKKTLDNLNINGLTFHIRQPTISQKRSQGSLCPHPQLPCTATYSPEFSPHDLGTPTRS